MATSLDAAESADFVELLPPEKLCETNSEILPTHTHTHTYTHRRVLGPGPRKSWPKRI